jgi:hypothetical protein
VEEHFSSDGISVSSWPGLAICVLTAAKDVDVRDKRGMTVDGLERNLL